LRDAAFFILETRLNASDIARIRLASQQIAASRYHAFRGGAA
jgi:hypothetical protein